MASMDIQRLVDALRREREGISDTAGTIARSLAAQSLGGVYGAARGGGAALAELMRSGSPSKAGRAFADEGAESVERAEKYFEPKVGPRTPEGTRNLKKAGEVVERVSKIPLAYDKTVGDVAGPVGEGFDKFATANPALGAVVLGAKEVVDPSKRVGKVGKVAKETATQGAEVNRAARLAREAEAAGTLGYDPLEMALQYPKIGKPEWAYDKKNDKWYLTRGDTPESKAVDKVRQLAIKDINAGAYTPHFDPEQRSYVDPSNYPLPERTIDVAMPKKQETIDRWTEKYDTPESHQRLTEAYDRAKNDPKASRWYAMKQLEDEFINELGLEEGRKQFRARFSQPMAATTGGSDPTQNLIASNYGNYLKETGQEVPGHAYEMPVPVGGRYITGNMSMYDKMMNQGRGVSAADQPKRHNFASNFEGHLDRPTVDEQMMKGIYPGKMAPEGDSYGVAEGVVNKAAAARGVQPVPFQEVAWAGLKDTEGKPMIEHVNDALYRTSVVTGLPQAEVLKQYIRGRIPLYGMGGAAAGAGALAEALRSEEQPEF